jgi:hypothetical protein
MNQRRLFEEILKMTLREDKTSLIDRSNLTLDQKEIVKGFFKKHPNYENKVDWNKIKTLTFFHFKKVMDQASDSKSSSIKKAKTGEDLSAIFKRKNVKVFYHDRDSIYVAPLDHEAAVFMDSFDCYGSGAKWCIGWENDDRYWKRYIEDEDHKHVFIMVYFKNIRKNSCLVYHII